MARMLIGCAMDEVHMERENTTDEASSEGGSEAGNGLLALQEAALRQLARPDPEFHHAVTPSIGGNALRWRMPLQFPDENRQLRLVDARLRDRHWKQLNA